MASPMPSISRQETAQLVRQVQGNQLFNRQLSSVCQVNGLKSTGVKADLQHRILGLIQETVEANDVSRFHQVRQSIANAFTQRSSPSSKSAAPARSNNPTPSHSSPSTQVASSMPSYNNGTAANQQRGYHGASSTASTCLAPISMYTPAAPSLTFKPSPFYQVETPVSPLLMTQHRNSITIPMKLSDHSALQRCLVDKSCRVMIFCAGEPSGLQDIVFPHQSELKVNSSEIKANLRGLKNKPGSTRPVDVTSALRLKSNQANSIDFTYALTSKKFYLIANVCKIVSVPDLVSQVSTRHRIPKESVIAELNTKAQDPDVVATSQVLSLKCPLSYMRLDTPCRSISCTHVQCFDATSYLQLQEQGPQWLCPICNNSAPYEHLAVDDYVRDILENTPKDLESVTIEPNGRWLIKSSQDNHEDPANGTSLEDDDFVELSETMVAGGRRMETPRTFTPSIRTPASSGRDGSASAARGAASLGAKRPAPAVIDLTGDSDEEEPMERPRKRQSTATNGVHEGSSLGFLSESPVDANP
ncbi:zinc finger domain-containing protein [Ophiocordyceps sinensis CO18]|uniref:Zinc finger domain-containing protein n=1 Tax=Ophiocordyceps sinensis (strain Co18 / CGMCC 3.14243) TaxID=911162 RepID=T5AC85_OPHSC|nr:zinc finger domain-containing protein [Ophiocordyceps sinensis CO18]